MKKIIFAVLILLAFSGCSKYTLPSPEEVSERYKGGFSASAFAAYDEETAKMEITKNSVSISFSLREPAELSGMSIDLYDEHAEVTYEGMTQNINTDNLPDSAPFLLLEELFDELSDPDEFALSTSDGDIVVQSEDFTAVLSPEDFSLKSAVFPRFDTEFEFSEWDFSS